MSLRMKILIYVLIIFGSIIGLYYILGDEHPWVILISSILILSKIKTLAVLTVVWSKAYLFFAASKGKIFTFISKMTFFKGISLAVKRFIIDNVVSKWIDKHIVSHIKKPIGDFFNYYKRLSWKAKIKKSILVIVPASLVSAGLYFGGYVQSFALYAQLKALVIVFFKALWAIAAKVFASIMYVFTNFIAGTWLAPIVEIFALSWLLSLVERIPYIGPPIKRFFDFLGQGFSAIFSKISFYFNKYFGNWISGHIGGYGERFGHYLDRKVNSTKVKNELFIFDGFERKYVQMNVQDYFKGKHPRDNKVDFYKSVNIKTDDNIDIKAFIEMDKSYEPLQDFLILEGMASHNEHGTSHEDSEIKKASFWVLNLNEKSVFVLSKKNLFEPLFLSQNSLKLIHPKTDDYRDFTDIYILDLNNKKYNEVKLVPQLEDLRKAEKAKKKAEKENKKLKKSKKKDDK